ncbi:hypothetical protein ABE613_15125 [Dorea sp. YH-dor228]
MANPPGPVFIGLDGYFILIFLQKLGYFTIFALIFQEGKARMISKK